MMTMTLPKIKFAIVFNRLKRKNSIPEKPIEIRAYQTGSPAKFVPTNIKVAPKYWDDKNKEVRQSHPNALTYNQTIYNLKFELQAFENKMINRYGSFSVKKINQFRDDTKKEYHSFKNYCYDELASFTNGNTHRSKKMHLKTFFQDFLKGKDLFFDDVDLRLIKRYDLFLKKKELAQNTIYTRHKSIKALINRAKSEKLLSYNPYDDYKVSRGRDENIKREFLTLEELQKIEQLTFTEKEKSLQRIQEFILICLYTGLRFSDANTLAPEHLKATPNGMVLLKSISVKTKKRIFLPLWLLGPKNENGLTKPEQLFTNLLERRTKEAGRSEEFDTIPFFGRSIQKINKPLKIIAEKASIDKNMTTHIGRRTFINVMHKDFGLPTAVVQELVQHSDIRTTMKYMAKGDEEIIDKLKKANINW